MFPAQIPVTNPGEFPRCEERRHRTDHEISLSPIQRTDVVIKGHIDNALWKDDVLRALDYHEIDVHVKNGTVYLSGHIAGAASQSRIKDAIRDIPGILGIKSNLVLDDRLTLEVAASLGNLEHTYGCKFFTGAAHGVVSLNGSVSDENVKLLAEQHVARNPNVRGVLNNVRVSGAERLQDQTFLQPTIGEIIYFRDGISGVVKHVIIDPNNRRVTAMIIQGKFADRRYEPNSRTDDKAALPGQLVVVPMSVVRYLTRVSGFLYINSNERNRYIDFAPSTCVVPNEDWVPPYPYCPDDVFFPAEYQEADIQFAHEPERLPLAAISEALPLGEQLIANDSPGG